MLTFESHRRSTDCDGATRRDFLRIGSLGLGSLALSDLLRLKAQAGSGGVKNKSVIWLWLSGGPTHVETFDPKMTAPAEYRSVTGEVSTALPGVTIGGTFPQLSQHMDKLAIVRSFAHGSSSHGTGTRWVMTGRKPEGRESSHPSMGSIVARLRGTSNETTGMPTYVRMNTIRDDGPAFLGKRYSPFNPGGEARENMRVRIPADRIGERRSLLAQLDGLSRDVDATGMMEGMDGFEQQAFSLILGQAQEAFDLNSEDPKLVQRYGRSGRNLLIARRLCEAGCSFITINDGGWDMHRDIEKSMRRKRELDQSLATLLADLDERGLSEDVLLVITGDFGRTPKINKRSGRDHWGNLCTLALAGGGLHMGQVVGESSPKLEVPLTTPIRPHDLLATVFHVFGFGLDTQVVNLQGRPVYLLDGGRPIDELI